MSYIFDNIIVDDTTSGTGLSTRASVKAATTATVDFLKGLENGDTLDGVTLTTNDRILVKDQASQAEITSITVPAGSAFNSVNPANYLLLYSANNATTFAFWFNRTDGTTTSPLIGGATNVQINITGANANTVVAAALKTAIDIYPASFSTIIASATVTVTNAATGPANDCVITNMPVGTSSTITQHGASLIENGIYFVQASGSPLRAYDFGTGTQASAAFIVVRDGTVNKDTGWLCTNDLGSDIVDTNPLLFKKITGNIDATGLSTDNAIVRWDGTSGTIIQNSVAILADGGDLTTPGSVRVDTAGEFFEARSTGGDYLQLGFDTVLGTFSMRQTGVGGALRFMTNADNPQILMGSPTGVGVGYIDVSNGMNLRLQTLVTGAVVLGDGGMLPETANTPNFGTTSNRFGNFFGTELYATDGLNITEKSALPITTGAGTGTIWVKDDTPNSLYFTSDGAVNHDVTPLSTKGDLIAHNGTIEVRVPVGTNNQVLIANSAASPGVQWTNASNLFNAFEAFCGINDTGGTNLTAVWADITLLTELKKTSNMTHTASSAEVTVVTAGTYAISGFVSGFASSGGESNAEARLMRFTGAGPYAEVAGTRVCIPLDQNGNDDRSTGTFCIVFDVVAGDKFKLQASRTSGAATLVTRASSGLTITTLGSNGATGATGPTGPTGAGSNIIVQEEGVTVAGGPHSTLNFIGQAITATNAGSGVANITVTGSGGIYTITAVRDNNEPYIKDNKTVYTVHAYFTFLGSTTTPVTGCRAIVWTDNASSNSQIRLYDSTNLLQICESAVFNNLTPAVVSLGALSNVPTGQALIEIQLKRVANNYFFASLILF